MEFITIDTNNKSEQFSNQDIVSFLYESLDQYGDEARHIMRCVEYAQKENEGKGGSILLAVESGSIVGAVVTNKTNMGGYIPENILVYIAVHKNSRGTGLGKQLMSRTIENCEGDIALHVEKDNPAKFLYEKLGFTNPYLEMRLTRK